LRTLTSKIDFGDLFNKLFSWSYCDFVVNTEDSDILDRYSIIIEENALDRDDYLDGDYEFNTYLKENILKIMDNVSGEIIEIYNRNTLKKFTDEHKKKISDKNKNMIMLKNVTTGESIKINKNDVDLYDKALWKNPAAISQRRETCVYCGVTSVAGNIKRWHNENCKEKK
jgi:hypothetical protein